jgi:hypothetical protein
MHGLLNKICDLDLILISGAPTRSRLITEARPGRTRLVRSKSPPDS